MTGLEKGLFEKKDFIRTENYNIRIRPIGVEKLMRELMVQFSSKTPYGKTNMEWGYVITKKAGELAKFLKEETMSLDFSKPEPDIQREDDLILREKILNMQYSNWKRMGYSKGTLHQLKKKASEEVPFELYGKVKDRLMVDGY
jgi:CRISPR-associated protein Cas1